MKIKKQILKEKVEEVQDVMEQALEQSEISKKNFEEVTKKPSAIDVTLEREPKWMKKLPKGLVESYGPQLKENKYIFTVKNRKELADLIGQLKESKLEYKINRSLKEDYRYDVSINEAMEDEYYIYYVEASIPVYVMSRVCARDEDEARELVEDWLETVEYANETVGFESNSDKVQPDAVNTWGSKDVMEIVDVSEDHPADKDELIEFGYDEDDEDEFDESLKESKVKGSLKAKLIQLLVKFKDTYFEIKDCFEQLDSDYLAELLSDERLEAMNNVFQEKSFDELPVSDFCNKLIDFLQVKECKESLKEELKVINDFECETGHTLDEYKKLYGDKYDKGELWDFSVKDVEDGAIEKREDVKYWLLKDESGEERVFEVEKDFEESCCKEEVKGIKHNSEEEKHFEEKCETCKECNEELVKTNKQLQEDLKIIESIWEYEPWSGAIETWEKIERADKIEELDFLLEDIYSDGLTKTELNDLLWFEADWVLEQLGLDESEDETIEDEEEVEEIEEVDFDRRAVEKEYELEDGELDGMTIREAETYLDLEDGELDRFVIEEKEEVEESLTESKCQWIYLFPDSGAMGDYKEECKKFNLKYLGKNEFEDEHNLVIKGSLDDLNDYAEWLGYELHPDYLYRENEFAGDIIEESVKDSDKDILLNTKFWGNEECSLMYEYLKRNSEIKKEVENKLKRKLSGEDLKDVIYVLYNFNYNNVFDIDTFPRDVLFNTLKEVIKNKGRDSVEESLIEASLNERMTDTYESPNFIAKCEFKSNRYRNYFYVHLIDKRNNREYAKGSYGWINRPYEGFNYKMALIDACRKYGLSEEKLNQLREKTSFQSTLNLFDELVNGKKTDESLKEGRQQIYDEYEDEYFKALNKAQRAGNVYFIVEFNDNEEEFETFGEAKKYAKKVGVDKIKVTSFGIEGPDGYDNGDYEEYDEVYLDLNRNIVDESLKEDVHIDINKDEIKVVDDEKPEEEVVIETPEEVKEKETEEIPDVEEDSDLGIDLEKEAEKTKKDKEEVKDKEDKFEKDLEDDIVDFSLIDEE